MARNAWLGRTHQLRVGPKSVLQITSRQDGSCTLEHICRDRQLPPERSDEPFWVPEQSRSIVDRRHHHVRRRQCARGQSLWSDDGDAERGLAEHVRVIRSIADRDHALGTHMPDDVRLLRRLGSSSLQPFRPHAKLRCAAMLSRRPNVSAETSCTSSMPTRAFKPVSTPARSSPSSVSMPLTSKILEARPPAAGFASLGCPPSTCSPSSLSAPCLAGRVQGSTSEFAVNAKCHCSLQSSRAHLALDHS